MIPNWIPPHPSNFFFAMMQPVIRAPRLTWDHRESALVFAAVGIHSKWITWGIITSIHDPWLGLSLVHCRITPFGHSDIVLDYSIIHNTCQLTPLHILRNGCSSIRCLPWLKLCHRLGLVSKIPHVGWPSTGVRRSKMIGGIAWNSHRILEIGTTPTFNPPIESPCRVLST